MLRACLSRQVVVPVGLAIPGVTLERLHAPVEFFVAHMRVRPSSLVMGWPLRQLHSECVRQASLSVEHLQIARQGWARSPVRH